MSIKEKIKNGKEKTMTWLDEHKEVIVGGIITGGVAILTCCGAYMAGVFKEKTSRHLRMGAMEDMGVTYNVYRFYDMDDSKKYKYPFYIAISKEDDEIIN